MSPLDLRPIRSPRRRSSPLPRETCRRPALEPAYGSFLGSVVNHGLNQALFKLGRRGLRVPRTRLPFLDRFAYELLLPVERP